MATTLPEHTVDTWTAWYVLDRFPGALVWAPTQREIYERPWDLGSRLGSGKLILFENKASSHRGPDPADPAGNRVVVHVEQLRRYMEGPAYLRQALHYVLPFPPFVRPRDGGPIPIEAASRRGDLRWRPCHDWMLVIRAQTLRRSLTRLQKTRALSEADVRALDGVATLAAFCDGVHACMIDGWRVDDRVNAHLGRPEERETQSMPAMSQSGSSSTVSAIHIPASVLPNF